MLECKVNAFACVWYLDRDSFGGCLFCASVFSLAYLENQVSHTVSLPSAI
jgi:hypothetical protein